MARLTKDPSQIVEMIVDIRKLAVVERRVDVQRATIGPGDRLPWSARSRQRGSIPCALDESEPGPANAPLKLSRWSIGPMALEVVHEQERRPRSAAELVAQPFVDDQSTGVTAEHHLLQAAKDPPAPTL